MVVIQDSGIQFVTALAHWFIRGSITSQIFTFATFHPYFTTRDFSHLHQAERCQFPVFNVFKNSDFACDFDLSAFVIFYHLM